MATTLKVKQENIPNKLHLFNQIVRTTMFYLFELNCIHLAEE